MDFVIETFRLIIPVLAASLLGFWAGHSFAMMQQRHNLKNSPIRTAVIESLGKKSRNGLEICKYVETDLETAVPMPILYMHIKQLISDGVIEQDFFGTHPGEYPKYRLTEAYRVGFSQN